MLKQSNQKSSEEQGSSQISRLSQVEMALEALRNVIKNNPGMLLLCPQWGEGGYKIMIPPSPILWDLAFMYKI
jgi:hypothetical protein